jgi:hydrogenase-4 component B
MAWNLLPAGAFWTLPVWYGLGCILPLLLRRERVATLVAAACAGLAALAALIAGIGVLLGAPAPAGSLSTNLPFGALSMRLDPLSAFFLLIVGLVSLPVALYSGGSLAHRKGRRVILFGSLFNLLLLSVVVIIAASDAIVFLMAWEGMAFLSYVTVHLDYEKRQVIRSAYLMLAVSELGTIGITGGFLLLYQAAGSFDFRLLQAAALTLSPILRSGVFLLAFFGFGAKAGLLPLQLWLPEAYAEAPDHISALLSGVITKLGIYGLLRFSLDFLGGGASLPSWWGLLTLGLGALTALIGILYAVVQPDLKRLLAYSSIENIGLIVAGLGAALTFQAYHLTALAAIAAIAALYHLLNHALYKGLLFLGAGAVQQATGTRSLARLGGLIRLMPWTAFFFILASLSIAAVPPLNGYISEWMVLETLLQSFVIPSILAKVLIAIAGGMLALAAGIAVTTFVRACGMTFLALPRSKEAAEAHEVARSMRAAMALLAVGCLVLGVLPPLVIPMLDHITMALMGRSVLNEVVPPLFSDHPGAYQLLVTIGGGLFRGLLPVNGLVVIAAPAFATIDSPSYLFLAELLFVGLLALGLRLLHPLGRSRKGPVWAGGIAHFTAAMTYTDLAFSNPIRIIFNSLYRSRVRYALQAAAARHRQGQMIYEQEIPGPFERVLYRPGWQALRWLTRHAQVIQSGNINQYVAYIFLIVLLILILRAL